MIKARNFVKPCFRFPQCKYFLLTSFLGLCDSVLIEGGNENAKLSSADTHRLNPVKDMAAF
jgi:hypothetical protein